MPVQQQQRHRLADDVAAADDDRASSRDGDAGSVEQLDDARRRAGHQPGATVIDVGTTKTGDRATIERLFAPGSKRHAAFERRGALTLGDVHPEVEQIAGALTPVPGGVGPLTIALLLANTVRAAELRGAR